MRPRDAGAIRLFVAIVPPPEVVTAMMEALDATEGVARKGDHPWPTSRRTPGSQVHLTLQFIGDRREQEVDEVVESVERSASGIGAFQLRPVELVTLPERGAARVVAVRTDAPPGLLEVRRRLAGRLARNPRADPGGRFTPHLTLCRFRTPARGFRVGEPLTIPPFAATELILIRSVLSPAGAEHRPVAVVRLSVGGTSG